MDRGPVSAAGGWHAQIRFSPVWLQNAVVMAVLGLICILISQITTIHADKTTGILSIKKRRLFLLVSTKEIPLNEVADCRVQSMRGSSNHGERHSNFRVAIIKKSGEIVPLHSWYSNGYGQKAQIVRRLAAFLGLAGAEDKPANLFQAAMQAQVVHTGMLEGLAHAASAPGAQMEQKGVTAGVAWSIERHFVGAQKVTRWICPAFTWPGHFLLIFQKPKGSPAASGGIMSAWVKMVLQQIVSMYGFLPGDMPGFETASGLPTNAALDADFFKFIQRPWRSFRHVKWLGGRCSAALGAASPHAYGNSCRRNGAIGDPLFTARPLSLHSE